MKRTLLSISAVLFVLTGVAKAQLVNTGGSLALTGQVEGSIGFFFWQDPSGFQLIEGGSSTTIAIGDVSAYGTANGLMPNKFNQGNGFRRLSCDHAISDPGHQSEPVQPELYADGQSWRQR